MKATCIIKKLSRLSAKTDVYIVGGAVRDWLMGFETCDLDFACGNPLKISSDFSDKICGKLLILDELNKIYRVVKKTKNKTYNFDFTKLKGKTIQEDLAKRDITINAMALKLKDIASKKITPERLKNYLIDPFGGAEDIKSKTIRLLSEKSVFDDPLRMLRVFRFSSELGFCLDNTTRKIIKRRSGLIYKSSKERIREELFKIFLVGDSHRYISLMDKAGLLNKILPVVERLKKSAKKFYFHPQGLWHHLTETFAAIEDIMLNIKKNFPKNYNELSHYLSENISSSTRIVMLKYATLLHDIGKPSSVKRIKNRVRFFGHEIVGTKLFEEVSKGIKLSNDEINFGKSLIKNHMRILQLVGTNSTTERATWRLMREAGENLPALALLSLADAKSYARIPGFEKNNLKDILKYTRLIVNLYFAKKKEKPRKKIIDGHIIMKRLKLKPGPLVGELLAAIDEEYNLNKIKTTEEALSLSIKILNNKSRMNVKIPPDARAWRRKQT